MSVTGGKQERFCLLHPQCDVWHWPVYYCNGRNCLITLICSCCSWTWQGQSELINSDYCHLKSAHWVVGINWRGLYFFFFSFPLLSPALCLTDRGSMVAVKGQLVAAHKWWNDRESERAVSKTERGGERAVISRSCPFGRVRLTSCQPGQLILCGTKNRQGRAFTFPNHLPLYLSPSSCFFSVYLVKTQICILTVTSFVHPSIPWGWSLGITVN